MPREPSIAEKKIVETIQEVSSAAVLCVIPFSKVINIINVGFTIEKNIDIDKIILKIIKYFRSKNFKYESTSRKISIDVNPFLSEFH